jgi:hypothetical protein
MSEQHAKWLVALSRVQGSSSRLHSTSWTGRKWVADLCLGLVRELLQWQSQMHLCSKQMGVCDQGMPEQVQNKVQL